MLRRHGGRVRGSLTDSMVHGCEGKETWILVIDRVFQFCPGALFLLTR